MANKSSNSDRILHSGSDTEGDRSPNWWKKLLNNTTAGRRSMFFERSGIIDLQPSEHILYSSRFADILKDDSMDSGRSIQYHNVPNQDCLSDTAVHDLSTNLEKRKMLFQRSQTGRRYSEAFNLKNKTQDVNIPSGSKVLGDKNEQYNKTDDRHSVSDINMTGSSDVDNRKKLFLKTNRSLKRYSAVFKKNQRSAVSDIGDFSGRDERVKLFKNRNVPRHRYSAAFAKNQESAISDNDVEFSGEDEERVKLFKNKNTTGHRYSAAFDIQQSSQSSSKTSTLINITNEKEVGRKNLFQTQPVKRRYTEAVVEAADEIIEKQTKRKPENEPETNTSGESKEIPVQKQIYEHKQHLKEMEELGSPNSLLFESLLSSTMINPSQNRNSPELRNRASLYQHPANRTRGPSVEQKETIPAESSASRQSRKLSSSQRDTANTNPSQVASKKRQSVVESDSRQVRQSSRQVAQELSGSQDAEGSSATVISDTSPGLQKNPVYSISDETSEIEIESAQLRDASKNADTEKSHIEENTPKHTTNMTESSRIHLHKSKIKQENISKQNLSNVAKTPSSQSRTGASDQNFDENNDKVYSVLSHVSSLRDMSRNSFQNRDTSSGEENTQETSISPKTNISPRKITDLTSKELSMKSLTPRGRKSHVNEDNGTPTKELSTTPEKRDSFNSNKSVTRTPRARRSIMSPNLSLIQEQSKDNESPVVENPARDISVSPRKSPRNKFSNSQISKSALNNLNQSYRQSVAEIVAEYKSGESELLTSKRQSARSSSSSRKTKMLDELETSNVRLSKRKKQSSITEKSPERGSQHNTDRSPRRSPRKSKALSTDTDNINTSKRMNRSSRISRINSHENPIEVVNQEFEKLSRTSSPTEQMDTDIELSGRSRKIISQSSSKSPLKERSLDNRSDRRSTRDTVGKSSRRSITGAHSLDRTVNRESDSQSSWVTYEDTENTVDNAYSHRLSARRTVDKSIVNRQPTEEISPESEEEDLPKTSSQSMQKTSNKTVHATTDTLNDQIDKIQVSPRRSSGRGLHISRTIDSSPVKDTRYEQNELEHEEMGGDTDLRETTGQSMQKFSNKTIHATPDTQKNQMDKVELSSRRSSRRRLEIYSGTNSSPVIDRQNDNIQHRVSRRIINESQRNVSPVTEELSMESSQPREISRNITEKISTETLETSHVRNVGTKTRNTMDMTGERSSSPGTKRNSHIYLSSNRRIRSSKSLVTVTQAQEDINENSTVVTGQLILNKSSRMSPTSSQENPIEIATQDFEKLSSTSYPTKNMDTDIQLSRRSRRTIDKSSSASQSLLKEINLENRSARRSTREAKEISGRRTIDNVDGTVNRESEKFESSWETFEDTENTVHNLRSHRQSARRTVEKSIDNRQPTEEIVPESEEDMEFTDADLPETFNQSMQETSNKTVHATSDTQEDQTDKVQVSSRRSSRRGLQISSRITDSSPGKDGQNDSVQHKRVSRRTINKSQSNVSPVREELSTGNSQLLEREEFPKDTENTNTEIFEAPHLQVLPKTLGQKSSNKTIHSTPDTQKNLHIDRVQLSSKRSSRRILEMSSRASASPVKYGQKDSVEHREFKRTINESQRDIHKQSARRTVDRSIVNSQQTEERPPETEHEDAELPETFSQSIQKTSNKTIHATPDIQKDQIDRVQRSSRSTSRRELHISSRTVNSSPVKDAENEQNDSVEHTETKRTVNESPRRSSRRGLHISSRIMNSSPVKDTEDGQNDNIEYRESRRTINRSQKNIHRQSARRTVDISVVNRQSTEEITPQSDHGDMEAEDIDVPETFNHFIQKNSNKTIHATPDTQKDQINRVQLSPRRSSRRGLQISSRTMNSSPVKVTEDGQNDNIEYRKSRRTINESQRNIHRQSARRTGDISVVNRQSTVEMIPESDHEDTEVENVDLPETFSRSIQNNSNKRIHSTPDIQKDQIDKVHLSPRRSSRRGLQISSRTMNSSPVKDTEDGQNDNIEYRESRRTRNESQRNIHRQSTRRTVDISVVNRQLTEEMTPESDHGDMEVEDIDLPETFNQSIQKNSNKTIHATPDTQKDQMDRVQLSPRRSSRRGLQISSRTMNSSPVKDTENEQNDDVQYKRVSRRTINKSQKNISSQSREISTDIREDTGTETLETSPVNAGTETSNTLEGTSEKSSSPETKRNPYIHLTSKRLVRSKGILTPTIQEDTTSGQLEQSISNNTEGQKITINKSTRKTFTVIPKQTVYSSQNSTDLDHSTKSKLRSPRRTYSIPSKDTLITDRKDTTPMKNTTNKSRKTFTVAQVENENILDANEELDTPPRIRRRSPRRTYNIENLNEELELAKNYEIPESRGRTPRKTYNVPQRTNSEFEYLEGLSKQPRKTVVGNTFYKRRKRSSVTYDSHLSHFPSLDESEEPSSHNISNTPEVLKKNSSIASQNSQNFAHSTEESDNQFEKLGTTTKHMETDNFQLSTSRRNINSSTETIQSPFKEGNLDNLGEDNIERSSSSAKMPDRLEKTYNEDLDSNYSLSERESVKRKKLVFIDSDNEDVTSPPRKNLDRAINRPEIIKIDRKTTSSTLVRRDLEESDDDVPVINRSKLKNISASFTDAMEIESDDSSNAKQHHDGSDNVFGSKNSTVLSKRKSNTTRHGTECMDIDTDISFNIPTNQTRHGTQDMSLENTLSKRDVQKKQKIVEENIPDALKKIIRKERHTIRKLAKMIDLREKEIEAKKNYVNEKSMEDKEESNIKKMKLQKISDFFTKINKLEEKMGVKKKTVAAKKSEPLKHRLLPKVTRRKPPKLFKTEKWMNKYFYSYLEKKLLPKYGIRNIVEAENLMRVFGQTTAVVRKSNKYEKEAVENLRKALKESGVCNSDVDFFHVVHQFLPIWFLPKLVPLIDGYPEAVKMPPPTLASWS